MAPSEPSTPSSPHLPLPPFNLGGFLGNLATQGSGMLFGQTPQNVGQDFSSIGSGVNNVLSQVKPAVQGLTDSGVGQFAREAGGYAFPFMQPFDPQSDLRRTLAGQEVNPQIAPQAGALLNKGLSWVSQNTTPPEGGASSFLGMENPADFLKSNIHTAVILGQGVGNLMQDQPNIERNIVDAFRQGFSPSGATLNPMDDATGKKAVTDLYNAAGSITNDLFDPSLLHQAIHDNMINQGNSPKDAQAAADALAAPIANLATFLSPTPLGKAMLFQFVAQFALNPGKTLDSVKQSGGDFFNLLGTSANNVFRGGKAPTSQEISDGLIGLANGLGMLAMGGHTGFKGVKGAVKGVRAASDFMGNRGSEKLQSKALGQDQPAAEVANRVAESANNTAEKPTAPDPKTINFGSMLQSPEAASVRAAIAAGSRMSNDEFAADSEQYGAKVYNSSTPLDARGHTGFLLNDGRYVELPNWTDGYRQHSRLLEDVGYTDRSANVADTTQVNRFLKDTGALKEDGRTEFASYGLPRQHMDAIVNTLKPISAMRDAGVYIEDVKAGKSYALEMGTLEDNEWNLSKALKDPSTRVYNIQGVDNYGPEDLRKTSQASTAGQTDQIGQARQADTAGAPQAASGTNQNSQGAITAPERQANQGVQGEGIPKGNAQPVSTQLKAIGSQASEGIPDHILPMLQKMLDDHGINPDGFINTVRFVSLGDKDLSGFWDPKYPNTINIDLNDLMNLGIHDTARNLRARLNNQKAKLDAGVYSGHPEYADAIRKAESLLSNFTKTATPENILGWITAHEAVHAGLGRIYDYPQGGKAVEVGLHNKYSYILEAVQLINHMKSTPEGSAWLNHSATQMGLKGEIGQLTMTARALGGMSPDEMVTNFEKAPSPVIAKTSEAFTKVNEALVHAVLIDKNLSPYPYQFASGDKAYATSYFHPEVSQENAQLAGKYYDTYRSQAASAVPSGAGNDAAARFQANSMESVRGAGRELSNQESITQEDLAKWQDSLDKTVAHLADIKSGKRLGNPILEKQLQTNIQLLKDKLGEAYKNPSTPIEEIHRQADAKAKVENPEIFQHPQPEARSVISEITSHLNEGKSPEDIARLLSSRMGDLSHEKFLELINDIKNQSGERQAKLTPENAQKALQEVQAARASRQAPRAKTLDEINKLNPAPKHYTDPRLTEGDVNKLSRYVMGHINRLTRQIEALDAAGKKDEATQVALKRIAFFSAWQKFFEPKTKPEDFKVATPPKVTDYVNEAQKIGSYSETHSLAPLKELAKSLVDSTGQFNAARSAEMNPADLARAQAQVQWDMVRFRSAYDLYNSKVFKSDIDKQDYNWGQTRNIARRVAASKATAPEKARMAARLIGEQIMKRRPDNPYTLHDAGEDLRKTAMGISKVAKNWHPELKKILAGEIWRVAREGWKSDPALPLGVKNIPVHEMMADPNLEDLKQQVRDTQRAFNEQISQFNMQRDRAKTLESAGRLAKGTVARMDKEQKARNVAFSNERTRIQSVIDNHPLTEQTRAIVHYLMTPEDVTAAANPTHEAAVQAMGENPNENRPVDQLISEAEALNERLNMPVPNPFSLDSFLDEGRSAEGLVDEGGGGNPPGGEPPVNNGQPWFSDNWAKALTDLREMGGTAKLTADLVDNLLKEMGGHLDPSRSMLHPVQWFKAHWERLSGIPYRAKQLERSISDMIKEFGNEDSHVNILRAIDDQNDVNRMQQTGVLSPSEAKIATFLNEYWKATRQVFLDPELGPDPLIKNFVENYVPHIVLEDPEGNKLFDERKQTWSRKSDFAKQRVADGATGEPIFKTLQSLQDRGYKVAWDVSKIFAAHANSTFRMMQLKELMNTLKGTIYESPDGKFKSFSIVSTVPDAMGRSQLDRMKQNTADYRGLEIFDKPESKIRFGPGDSMFDHYRVHPDLARYVERLASMNDIKLPGMAPARALRWLGGLFKFIQFSINPRHAFNIYSNVANMTSAFGIADPRVFNKIYGRANRAMLPEDRSRLYKATHPNSKADMLLSLDKSASIEKRMRELFEAMQEAGFDPLDPSPTTMTPREASLRDEYTQMRAELMQEHSIYNEALAVRDRELLASLLSKGLVQDHDLIQGADLNALSNFSEKIPGVAQFHRWMWRDVVWRGQLGVAMHLADQFIMKAASKAGWDGKGGAATAETHLPADLIDGIHREAVYTAKQATGLLNKLDMSTNWQVYGRATLISSPWTMGQLQATRDTFGTNKFTQALGKQDYTKVSDRQLQSGFTKNKAMFLDDMHTKLARRMVYSGTAKLAMTSLFLSSIGSYMLTNQVQTPIENFLRDPMHTFDIYAGRDPATQQVLWIDNPFFGFQHELVNYVMAGLKAAMEGKPPVEMGVAPIVRFLNKDNPMINLMLDLATGTEVSRWLAGLDPSMNKDADLQNLHAALDQLGVPDFGSNEDRILYALRVISPSPGGFATTAIKRDSQGKAILDDFGNPIPLTDTRSILNDFGVGGFLNPALDAESMIGQIPGLGALAIPSSPDNAEMSNSVPSILGNLKDDIINPRLGLFAAGSTETQSTPLYDPQVSAAGVNIQQDPNGYFPQQAQRANSAETHQQTVNRDMAMIEIANLASQGTPEAYQKIAQIRDQQGLTDAQVTNAILHKTSVQDNNGKYHTSSGLLGTRQPASGIVTINGVQLSESQSAQYNKMKNNRQLYVIQQLQNNTTFKNADTSTKTMMVNQLISLSDKFNTAQAGQQFLGTGGQALSDNDFQELVNNSLNSRQDVETTLQLTPQYQSADAAGKLRLMQSYMSMADTITWNRQFGNLKALSNDDVRSLITGSVQAESEATAYLQQTPFYQSSNPQDQAAMEKEYADLSKQMIMNIYTGKSAGMNPIEVPMYMRAVVNTEETAKYLLHQSDFYQLAPLQTQAGLDKKYATYSRQLALNDWQKGQPLLNLGDANNAYNVGPEQLIVGHIMAEQGYTDLQNQYGGANAITAYEKQLSDLKKQVKENMLGTPTQISRVQTIITRNFEAANPQYGAFIKARTAWERGSQIGRLYLALNADEQALATVDTSIISDATGINAGADLTQSIDNASLLGGDVTSDPTAIDPNTGQASVDPTEVDPSQLAVTDPNALG